MHPRTLGTALATLLVGATLAQALPAWASTFSVSPVQVLLTGQSRSAILTLQNTSQEPLRFQLDVQAWAQDPQGAMQLQPTRDIVFFPQLLSLAPGQERKVRLGATVPPGAIEKTYRLFVQELPPRETPGATSGSQVRVLTRMGIPVFLQPPSPRVEGRVEALAVRQGRLSFEVRNRGTVHFVVHGIRLTGYDAGSEAVLHGALEGWYVLAGGVRRYEVEIPPADCGKVQAVAVEVDAKDEAFSGRVELSSGACAP